jgi:arylsulfatase A
MINSNNSNSFTKYFSGFKFSTVLLTMSSVATFSLCSEASAQKKPNIVLIFADDLGYADLSCYGAAEIKTPNLDKMAEEGVRFTDFYASAPVCSPSRASLLTGCYPKRIGLNVYTFASDSLTGINPGEITIAELLKEQGYATGCIGKWDPGQVQEVVPLANGFDYYYGIIGPNHGKRGVNNKYDSHLWQNDSLLKKNWEINYDEITIDYTEKAISFIKKNKNTPFFLYLPHNAIHVPLFASEGFRRHSGRNGLYRDMVEELDWSCGEIMKSLSEAGILQNTIVIFTSDNGPYNVAATPLHGGKGSTWEGGFRVPFIVRWPKAVAAGRVCNEMATMMDLLPTLASLAGSKLPSDHKIDGYNILPLLTNKKDSSLYHFFYYYDYYGNIAAIRQGKWKLHLLEPREKYAGKQLIKEALLDTRPSTPLPWLYDLSSDIGETKNIAASNPEVVEHLRKQALTFDSTLTTEIRPAYHKNKLSSGKVDGKWDLLIKDNSTTGWHTYLKDSVIGWKVEDGILYTPGKQGDIVTNNVYENFDLSLEWKINDQGNSGVFYNVVERPEYKRMYETGPEFQIIDDVNYPEVITERQKTGSLSDVIAPSTSTVKKTGEWNLTRILVDNGHVEHWLNGKKILEYELWSKDIKEKIANSKFAKSDYAQAKRGHIGLQDHGNPVHYRNIKIKVL